MKQPEWAEDDEAAGFLREAEAVLQAKVIADPAGSSIERP
jgi:hypothetical protein